ncbi:MAG: acyltransferase [Alphaproteobacteria bacterium PRO2]|nr:acyltransferase [Alphaproteobacteria bacterium PRO2]
MFKFEQHRFRVLDSWRGLAACFVALFHFRNFVYSHLFQLDFVNNAHLFVDFFFVLSGFVIFANYEEKLQQGYSLWKFMLLRFGRLYPLHFLLLMLVTLYCLAELYIPAMQHPAMPDSPFRGAGELPYFWSQLLLAHGLGIDDRLSFNRPSWTVSAEFYTYALFAMLVLLFKNRIGPVLVLIAAAAGYYLYSRQIYIYGTYDYGFLRCIYSFAIGALLWRFFARVESVAAPIARRKTALISALEILLVMAMIMAVTISSEMIERTMALPFLFAAAIFVFSFEAGILSRVLSRKPFLLIGAVSYSIYMLQIFIVSAFAVALKLLPGPESALEGRMVWGDNLWIGDLVVILYLFVVVAAAIITYYLVEMPGRDYFRKLAGRAPDGDATANKDPNSHG